MHYINPPILMVDLTFHNPLDESVSCLTLYLPETKIAAFANSVDLTEVAHDEPPHLDLHSLPSSL